MQIWGNNEVIKVILAANSVKYIWKKLTYDSQFTTNSNGISFFILENLISKKDDFIKKDDVTLN